MYSPRRLVTVCSAAYFALGLWIATSVPGPLLSADDVAYLAMGRTLGGHGAAPLFPQPPYGVLYPALTVPGWFIGLGEGSMLTYARGLNALAGALLVPVLFLIVRRLWRPTVGLAITAALVGAGLPSLWLTASIAWTERLLALLVALALLALLRLFERPGIGRLSLVVLAAVACVAAHPRMAPVALVVFVAAALLVHEHSRVWSTGALAGGVALIMLAEAIRRLVASATFDSAGTYDVGDLASRRGIGEMPEMLQHGAGTIAYLVLAGTGLAVIGVVLFWRTRPIGLVVPVLVMSLVAMAGWFLTGVERSDAWLHGRYVEVVAPVLVSAGVIGLARLSWRLVVPVLVVTPVVAGIVGAWAGPGNNWSSPRSPVMMLGVEVSGAPFGNDIFEPGAAASVALVVGVGMWSAWRVAGPFALLALFAVVTGTSVLSGVESLGQLHDGAIAGQVAEVVDDAAPIDGLVVASEGLSPNLVAALVWEVGFDEVGSEITEQTSHLLLPTEAMPPSGAELVAEFNGGTLWLLR